MWDMVASVDVSTTVQSRSMTVGAFVVDRYEEICVARVAVSPVLGFPSSQTGREGSRDFRYSALRSGQARSFLEASSEGPRSDEPKHPDEPRACQSSGMGQEHVICLSG